MLGHVLGIFSAVFGVLSLLGIAARKLPGNNKLLRRLFRGKLHRVWGDLMLFTGVLHGAMAVVSAQGCDLLPMVTGVLLCLAGAALAVSGYGRKAIGAVWFRWHKATAALTVLLLLIHC